MNGENELPEGWEWIKLGEIVSPSKEKIDPEANSSFPYLGLEHIESNSSKIIGQGIAGDVTSTKTVFYAGDVLYGKLRPYLNKVAIPDFNGVCSTDILVFHQNQFIINRYLMRYLSTEKVVEYANLNSKGNSLPRVSFDSLAQIPLPLPPLAEQRRIVAAVEALLARVNAARERLERVQGLLKEFRQAVLAAACSGRLTEGWRAEHPEVNISPKFHQNQKQFCFSIPDSWDCQTIENILRTPNSLSYGILKPGDFDPDGVPMIRVMDIGEYGINDTNIFRVSPKIAQNYKRTILEPGDILLAIMATVGRSIVVPKEFEGYNVNRALAVIKLKKEIDPYYICSVIRSPFFQNKFSSEKIGSAQARINLKDLRQFPIPLPPLPEQHEIVRRVESLFALADCIEQRVAAGKERADRLTQAILAKAFRGELVPTEAELARKEGRDYEPASVLLERIQRERELQGNKKPGKKRAGLKKGAAP